MINSSNRDLLQFALDAAWQAGRITLGYFQTGVRAERKSNNTPVTIADREAEQKIRRLIQEQWPDHGIHGEEYGRSAADSPYTWIIDPIDGTKSFISGVPLYSTLLALMDGDKALLGVIHLPALNETVYAVRGEGCYWNGRRAHVSTVAQLENAVALCSEMESLEKYGRLQAWQKIMRATYVQRTWGDGYGYALVATGRAEIMMDPALAPWDAGPLGVIIEEAGGAFTDWQGNSSIHAGEGIATNGALFKQVMALIGDL
ncbi:MAG: histidinol-phosphatase [Chloroflexi bacterium]|nr:histidinol-phosphatase [Chloroflexota bacterium]